MEARNLVDQVFPKEWMSMLDPDASTMMFVPEFKNEIQWDQVMWNGSDCCQVRP